MKTVFKHTILVALLICLFAGQNLGAEVVADKMLTIKASSSSPAIVLAYSQVTRVLDIYEVNDVSLKKIASSHIAAPPHHAIRTRDGKLILALGYGRGALKEPIRIVSTDLTLKKQTEVFKFESPRSQINFFKEIDDKIWMNFFDSKYFTQRGYLTATKELPWTFTEVGRERLATSMAIVPPFTVIGRPYGDAQGENGDLRIEIGKQIFKLPSFRGVSSVALLPPGGRKYPNVLAGDGWHQNYGKIAEARLSMFTYNSDKNTYNVKTLDTDRIQFRISKIIPLIHSRKLLVLAGGNKALNLYDSSASWKRQQIFVNDNKQVVFDFGLLTKDQDSLLVALYNGKISLKRIKL